MPPVPDTLAHPDLTGRGPSTPRRRSSGADDGGEHSGVVGRVTSSSLVQRAGARERRQATVATSSGPPVARIGQGSRAVAPGPEPVAWGTGEPVFSDLPGGILGGGRPGSWQVGGEGQAFTPRFNATDKRREGSMPSTVD